MSPAQHMIALEKANKVRRQMAAVKKQISSGKVDAVDAFKREDCANLTVLEVLTAQRRWGPTRARRFLNRTHLHRGRISLESVKLQDLTIRERRALTEALKQNRNGKPKGAE